MRPIIGITLGDPAGIGPEITLKSLAKKDIYDCCVPVVIGDANVLRRASEYTGKPVEINIVTYPADCKGICGCIDCIDLQAIKQPYEMGKVSAVCGAAAFSYITYSIELAMENKIAAVVTGPIKFAIRCCLSDSRSLP